MKGIIVFNEQLDAVFVHADGEFKAHINKQAEAAGLIDKEESQRTSVDPNVLVQLFSPLVASQRFMIGQLGNPYHSVLCENGFLFVFEQFGDEIQIAINGDGKENKELLHRKLLVLQRIVGFFYGPVTEEIRPESLRERQRRWKFIGELLDTWCLLYGQEQCFLVEAIERLYVNQTLNARCIELLEGALASMRAAGEKFAVHGLLLVGCKLLALYSSRNAYELQASDILLITLLVQHIFPATARLEDLFSVSYKAPSAQPQSIKVQIPTSRERVLSGTEGDLGSDAEQEQYFSTPSTPTGTPREEPHDKPTDPTRPQRVSSGASLKYYSPKEPVAGSSKVHDSDEFDEPDGRSTSSSGSNLPTEGASSSTTQIDEEEAWPEPEEYQRFRVLLRTPACKYTPHVLHCIRVLPGTVLVVISEAPGSKQATGLCQMLSLLKALIHQQRPIVGTQQGKSMHETIDSNIKKLSDAAKKTKGKQERLMRDVTAKWEQAKKAGVLTLLDRDRGAALTPGLEGALGTLLDRLRDVFKVLFLLPKPMGEDAALILQDGVEQIQETLRCQLRDYKDYLTVKAQRNITMTTYLEEFPGLIHFIYVDRATDQITAPSINVTKEDEEGNMDATIVIRDKVWGMAHWVQSKLQEGYTSMMARQGDFIFTYFLWFEDNTGTALPVHQPYPGSEWNIPPGILTANFFKQVTKHCFPSLPPHAVHCYELMCMHMGLVPSHYVLSHCHKLAAKLWETSGDVNTPISLL